MNGQSERVAKRLSENVKVHQQKEGWLAWTLKAPFRGAWWVIKHTVIDHPILTSLAVAGLAWQLPNILRYFSAVEAGGAMNAAQKVSEYSRRFLPMTGGTPGVSYPSVRMPLPYGAE